MANKNKEQDKQLRQYLEERLQKLKKRDKELSRQLKEKFSVEVFREQNILSNSIECCERRLKGTFSDARGEFEQSIPQKSKTFHY